MDSFNPPPSSKQLISFFFVPSSTQPYSIVFSYHVHPIKPNSFSLLYIFSFDGLSDFLEKKKRNLYSCKNFALLNISLSVEIIQQLVHNNVLCYQITTKWIDHFKPVIVLNNTLDIPNFQKCQQIDQKKEKRLTYTTKSKTPSAFWVNF